MSGSQQHDVDPSPESAEALAILRAAGHPVDLLSTGQQQVFASLTRPEVELLNSIKRRLDAVADDVVAHEHEVKIL
ncbi:aroma-sacti cluster domain-containing protein [Polymorphospora sp. NPDC050346]|uniref:aroma-sacti cluster domain-containing protein n=1 Tax=Polymorphospora sp. NPDC050346 TaxID=3155780 RepID=UPI0033D6E500